MIEQWSAVSSKEKIEYTVRLKQSEQNTQTQHYYQKKNKLAIGK